MIYRSLRTLVRTNELLTSEVMILHPRLAITCVTHLSQASQGYYDVPIRRLVGRKSLRKIRELEIYEDSETSTTVTASSQIPISESGLRQRTTNSKSQV